MTTAWYYFSPILQTRDWGTEVLQNLPKISRLTSCGALIFCHVPKPSAFTTVLWCLPSQVFVAHLFWFRLVVVIWDLGVSITLKISCWQKSIVEIATRVTSLKPATPLGWMSVRCLLTQSQGLWLDNLWFWNLCTGLGPWSSVPYWECAWCPSEVPQASPSLPQNSSEVSLGWDSAEQGLLPGVWCWSLPKCAAGMDTSTNVTPSQWWQVPSHLW